MDEALREELSSLVSSFRTYLQWRQDRGARWHPAGDSPRYGVAEQIDEPSEQAMLVDGQAMPVDGQAMPVDEQTMPEDEQAMPGEQRATSLIQLRQELGDCRRCRLFKERKNIVFGVGHPDADLMFIGEAPGRDEDIQGEPFVGAAGQLLTKMIQAMGLDRDQVYIANIIKCRPPRNRDPNPDEIDACEAFLRRQIDVIGPRLIIALGSFAARTLLRTESGVTQLRGRFHTYHGIPLMPTFHPAYLLRNPGQKRPVWNDLKMVMAEMDRLGLKRRH